MPDETKLTVEIKNETPVLLEDFTQSFRGLADEYESYVHERATEAMADVRLYVREIRTGSIIADLVALAPLALPFVENANTVVGFAQYLTAGFNFLRGATKEKPPMSKRDYENLSAIVEPTAKDGASQFNVSTTFNGNVVVNLNLDSRDANAIQNSARRELAALKEPATGLHEKVLMYLYQARNDPKSDKGDRAIIESIYPSSVKVIFINEQVKAQALRLPENPFKCAYVVDVSVETVEGRPALYRVQTIHDVFDKPVA